MINGIKLKKMSNKNSNLARKNNEYKICFLQQQKIHVDRVIHEIRNKIGFFYKTG